MKLRAILAIFLFTIGLSTAHASDQRGLASYYGPYHHGRLMANGRPFDQLAATAAHRYLRLGTVVSVTNTQNGKVVTATITDRGPYKHPRILDVSLGLARTLGMIKSGVAPVEIHVLSAPEGKGS